MQRDLSDEITKQVVRKVALIDMSEEVLGGEDIESCYFIPPRRHPCSKARRSYADCVHGAYAAARP